MKAILVFIDGTICDTRGRDHLVGKPAFSQREGMPGDLPIPGSVECLNRLSERYEIVYIAARPESTRPATAEWLGNTGFPEGALYLAEHQAGRLSLVEEMKDKHDFFAGIGDRWDDNELHAEMGCHSIILQEYEGQWNGVFERIDKYHRQWRIEKNRTHLQGKVEGLARVCPLLLAKYGKQMWDVYFTSVMEMAEATRADRKAEDLASFATHGLNPADLRDAARWEEILREEDWENNPVYGLQQFELVEASPSRYIHKVTRCYYAELWKKHGRPEIGYPIHCRTDMAWWDKPAWNPQVRFEQPKTLMQGDDYCLFIQTLPGGRRKAANRAAKIH